MGRKTTIGIIWKGLTREGRREGIALGQTGIQAGVGGSTGEKKGKDR